MHARGSHSGSSLWLVFGAIAHPGGVLLDAVASERYLADDAIAQISDDESAVVAEDDRDGRPELRLLRRAVYVASPTCDHRQQPVERYLRDLVEVHIRDIERTIASDCDSRRICQSPTKRRTVRGGLQHCRHDAVRVDLADHVVAMLRDEDVTVRIHSNPHGEVELRLRRGPIAQAKCPRASEGRHLARRGETPNAMVPIVSNEEVAFAVECDPYQPIEPRTQRWPIAVTRHRRRRHTIRRPATVMTTPSGDIIDGAIPDDSNTLRPNELSSGGGTVAHAWAVAAGYRGHGAIGTDAPDRLTFEVSHNQVARAVVGHAYWWSRRPPQQRDRRRSSPGRHRPRPGGRQPEGARVYPRSS